MEITDAEILNWIERHPGAVHHSEGTKPNKFLPQGIPAHWRRLFGEKSAANRFPTLREAVKHQIREERAIYEGTDIPT